MNLKRHIYQLSVATYPVLRERPVRKESFRNTITLECDFFGELEIECEYNYTPGCPDTYYVQGYPPELQLGSVKIPGITSTKEMIGNITGHFTDLIVEKLAEQHQAMIDDAGADRGRDE